ncbi:hypothetical protein V6N13_138216 [Hibiscus sabdariffa]|uniref:Uncharacterized protein n=1 Tax=Hibiscus sabdariffa TaxID=183260 RepID=A0ABR2QCV9_9ROSI
MTEPNMVDGLSTHVGSPLRLRLLTRDHLNMEPMLVAGSANNHDSVSNESMHVVVAGNNACDAVLPTLGNDNGDITDEVWRVPANQ